MPNSNNSYSQFELFPKDPDSSDSELGRVRTQIKDLTLSIENIIVVGIVLMMMFVLFFSFGVERGKRISSVEGTFDHGRNKESAKPFVREETETVEVTIDTSDLVSDTEDLAEDQEVIQVPVERELTDEHLFTIQVASFKTKTYAQKEADTLDRFGTEIFVLPKGSYNIVCVGRFSEREKAKQFSKQLKSKYRDLLVRRL